MSIRIYNTLTRKKEHFEPLQAGKVSMYVCGPTVYDSCHIGHARSAVVFDVIIRYFEACGYDVTYVRNFTDVDDKIIQRAQKLNTDYKIIAEKYIAEFYNDMDALYVRRATIEPKATDHIAHIIHIIEALIEKNFAYRIDGDVFFSVKSFDGYGKLSGRKLEDMEAGARVDVDTRKHNPFDFALWKAAKPGEPFWESPWGKGRPGWHIECSAMSSSYLGQTFDIHGGGKDLIFPHHENEIAQSEAANGKPFARYWIHNGFVNIDHEKMSKSLGNFLLIRDVLKSFHPEAVRLFLLSNHYRSPVDFTGKAMEEADSALDKIYALLERVEKELPGAIKQASDADIYWQRFKQAMDDDFNSALGIGILFEAVRAINRLLDENRGTDAVDHIEFVETAVFEIKRMGNVLGLLTESWNDYFSKKRERALTETKIDPVKIETMIQERQAARKAKDWAKADQIRDRLAELKVTIKDGPEGTTWKVD
ncbi:MAG: cysteine--tRNA ligase [Desulfobacterales bacterium]|jgi:cysteinyl-tRNA synthetase|nr:cysteine--tRNA ligase [Desulfobacterales bacterium]